MSTTIVAKLIVAASLVISPLAASAAGTSAAQPAAAETGKKADAGDKKICKQLPSSSSRLPQRVCLTEKEWKQVEADSQ
jgi:predicted transglutaminase-like cysteine proteinase